jgi:hypothetical protein
MTASQHDWFHNPATFHSTVVDVFPKVTQKYNPQSGHSLLLLVKLTSSNLWVSTYTPYQQELYDIISKLHDDDGWDFKQVSDWLNGKGYKTPRGKTFKENHVWSIYTKKNRSINRFSREYVHSITDLKIDSVDYLPNPQSE